MNKFLTNIWYMAAWSHEVTDIPMSRQMLGMGMVLYRTSDGSVVALRDRCPHRFAPLSRGKVIGDCIQCPYHGLLFDRTGQCVDAPLEVKPPQAMRVQTFPVIERDQIVWFWPGDKEADPSLIPDFSYLSDPTYKHVFGVTRVEAHFELETDNLMDLSHVELLHAPFSGVLSQASKYRAFRKGTTVHSNWFSANAQNPVAIESGPFPTNGEPIDQWLEMRWDPPGSMYLEIAVTRSGNTRDQGYTMPGVHILTPETDDATLYFWAGSLHVNDQVPMDLFRQDFVQTFEHEDRPMIEAVAHAMGGETDLLGMKPLLLRSDAGSVLARRTLAELITTEKVLQ
jgi:phenylpropionate dioxygenase-like ring-hydroxylating dioxygenase large terminal subunit